MRRLKTFFLRLLTIRPLIQRSQLISAHKWKVHDISNIEVIDPVILLSYTQIISYRYFELFILLNSFNVFHLSETNVQFVTLGHKVFNTISVK